MVQPQTGGFMVQFCSGPVSGKNVIIQMIIEKVYIQNGIQQDRKEQKFITPKVKNMVNVNSGILMEI